MGLQTHLMLRGRVFYWRRKIRRFSTGTCDLQASLRTTDRILAGKIARKLSVESDAMTELMAQGRISDCGAALFFRAVAARGGCGH